MAEADVQARLRALALPAASTLGAGLTFAYALFATPAGPVGPAPGVTPERVAEQFVESYQGGDYATAARLARGTLRRRLEARARGAAQTELPIREGRLAIDESSTRGDGKLRLAGAFIPYDQADAASWPVAVTLVRESGRYAVVALHWPRGAPPEGR